MGVAFRMRPESAPTVEPMHQAENYRDVRRIPTLPRVGASDSRVVTKGFAVEIARPRVAPIRVFCTAVELTIAFGRAARMSSGDVTSYGLEGLRVIEWREALRSDVTTRYAAGSNLDRQAASSGADGRD